jgi:hypothetical protein
MDRKLIDWVVVAAGLLLLVLSLFADQFGYGDEGFGWLQWVGTIVGAIVGIGGLADIWRRRGVETAPTTPPTQPSH